MVKTIEAVKEFFNDEKGKYIIYGAVGIAATGIIAYLAYKYNSKSTDNEHLPRPEIDDEAPKSPAIVAQDHKNRGNKYFKGQNYEKALECYSKALDICPEENGNDRATFHQNRAACFEKMGVHERVVEECTMSIKYNQRYIKALKRRAVSYENLSELVNALEDITAVCILEEFKQPQSYEICDRILKAHARKLASEKYKLRVPKLPSNHFINSYFVSFRFNIFEVEGQDGDSPFLKACNDFANKSYGCIIKYCTDEINRNSEYHIPAHLARGTFYLLSGDSKSAMDDLNYVIENPLSTNAHKANAYIKRGSLKVQQWNSEDSKSDFDEAVKIDSSLVDPFHHRGQLFLIMDNIPRALEDFEKCNQLDSEFEHSFIQMCYAKYRQCSTSQDFVGAEKALTNFKHCLERFPNCSDGYALYAQAMAEQGKVTESLESFDKAISLDPLNASNYVHKGVLVDNVKNDRDAAIKLLQKAISVDDRCDFAYEMLGTIEVQRLNYDEAIRSFNAAIEIAKFEMELAHLFSLREAAASYKSVKEKYGITMNLERMKMI